MHMMASTVEIKGCSESNLQKHMFQLLEIVDEVYFVVRNQLGQGL